MAKSRMHKIKNAPGGLIRAALYIRVSTDRQAEEGYSIEVQKERLIAFSKTFDGEVVYELYIDDGFSGASLVRPAMQRLILDAENRAVTHVCVYKLDRLSRSQKDTLHLIEDVFLPNDVAFISIQESFNTATAFGRAVIGILSVFAQLERENIYERTRGGMQKRVEAGYWPGGGGVPFGYDYDLEKGILVPNADAGAVRQVYELYLQGYSLQNIANRLGLKYEKLAAQILLRKTNIGIIEYNGVEYKGLHEPIVSAELFARAIALHAQRAEKRLAPTSGHLLTGLIYCGVCGAKMRYQKWGRAGFKLVCYSQQVSKPYLVRDPGCDNERVWAEDIEKAVAADLAAMTADEVSGGNASRPLSLAETLRKKRAQLEQKLRRLYDLYAEAGNSVLLASINGLTDEIKKLDDRLLDEEKRGLSEKTAEAARERLRNIREAWPYMEMRERRSLIASVIDRITVTHNAVRIDYKY
ncbi:MAG: recombinase family protein [Oscillospiraceae bacterium]|jgi:site-specific DNA recombinase|nr:recombinase family protein [Oscillospiraceae bacterium]